MLYEGTVAYNAIDTMYSATILSMEVVDKKRVTAIEMRFLRSMYGVTGMDRVRHEDVRT